MQRAGNRAVRHARGAEQVTSSDPNAKEAASGQRRSLDASDPALLTAPYKEGDKRWPASSDHYRNWLEHIATRTDPIAPVDQAGRSLEACAAGWIAMKLGRRLSWDPVKERFTNDAEAQKMCARTPRAPEYDIARIMKKAGLA